MLKCTVDLTLRLSPQSTGDDCSSHRCTNRILTDQDQSAESASQNLLGNHLAHVYSELAASRAQIQQLTRKSAVGEAGTRRLLFAGLSGHFDRYGEKGQCLAEIPEDTVLDGTDIFDDCVSHVSEDHPHTLIDRLRAHFTNRLSPDDFFETLLTFVGEQYTIETRLGEPAAVVAMTEIHYSSTHRLQKYFLIYAEAPRLWRRVAVSATILRSSESSVDSGVAAPDLTHCTYKTLPGSFQYQLQALLKNLTLLETVTQISLTIAEHFTGYLTIDTFSRGCFRRS